MTGANVLAPGFVTGRRMLNLDTEEEGAVYVGCAGGLDTVATTKVARTTPGANAKSRVRPATRARR